MVAILDSYEAEALWLAEQGHVITGELSDWPVGNDDVIGGDSLVNTTKAEGFLVNTSKSECFCPS